MKKSLLKKISLLTLATVVSTSVSSYSYANAATNVTSLTSIQSQNALDIYNNLINNKTINIKKPNNSIKSLSYKSDNNLYTGDFTVLNELGSKTESKEVIYSDQNNSVKNIITYDKATDTYSLLEIDDNNTDEITYIVNGEEFKIVQEGENINMYSKNGQVLPLVITEYLDDSTAIPNSIPTDSISNLNQSSIKSPISNISTKSWGSKCGPYHRTNKVAIEIISEVAGITGLACFKCKHPLLGKISLVTSAISYLGNKAYATLYIEYYQYHDSSNFTYIKQVDNYYQYNNYTGFVKSITSYFYSSKPY